MKVLLLPWALLMAAPVFSQPTILDFQLTEDGEAITKMLGRSAAESEFGTDFLNRQFQIGVADLHDYSHYIVFRRSTGKVISIAQNFEPERIVDDLFPPAETSVCHYPNPGKRLWSVRVRRLSGRRVLIAMGSAAPGRPTGQLLLIRETDLLTFYPWVHEQLTGRK